MNFLKRNYLCLFLFIVLLNGTSLKVHCQVIPDTNRTIAIDKRKLKTVAITTTAIGASAATLLYYAWYRDYPQSSFHFFNDNDEWLQIDKFGHTTTAYYLGVFSYDALAWSGLNNTQSTIYSGIISFAGLALIEVFDGFSAAWGASSGDLAANFTGTSLFVSQQLLWKEQRIALKYSFHATDFSNYRPDLLGNNVYERLIKEYNGQTYWLSANIHSFLPEESGFPKWINIAAGYGADGMTGARSNASEYDGISIPRFDRVRQFYLSPDIDLRRIPTKNKTLKTVFKVISFIKIPMPTLEVDENGKVRFYLVYF
ncbi:MAG: DUF2279 domain-containing protein [Bacteroidales bacterium]|nr:DUF2279 domain-containing protein [Bacteroidales bacterium]